MRKNKMADPLFGHDGRCDFYGVNLVEIDKKNYHLTRTDDIYYQFT